VVIKGMDSSESHTWSGRSVAIVEDLGALRVSPRVGAADGRERGDRRSDGGRRDAVGYVGATHAPVQALACDWLGG
jgi:hypothetical protein